MSGIVERIVAGDMRAAARLIRDVDDGNPEVREILKRLYPHTGRAYVIGITGAPGVGKSTLVDQLIRHIRAGQKTVGVLAIDPTSPFSGGAILGDRARMQRHSEDEGVFIRSMATRGAMGGLSQATRSAVDVFDAMGKDYIIIETVGAGQDEVDVAKSAHTTVIIVIPGMGDGLQAIKAGILEVGDIFAINKADREGVDRTESELRSMLEMDSARQNRGCWTPPIVRTEAIHDKGVSQLLAAIESHRKFIHDSAQGIEAEFKRQRISETLTELVKARVLREVFTPLAESADFQKAVTAIAEGELDPYSACDGLVLPSTFHN